MTDVGFLRDTPDDATDTLEVVVDLRDAGDPQRSPDAPWLSREANLLNATSRSMKARRVIDVLGSAAALIILSPLLAIVALLIKLTSRGPVLFTQGRVGRDGIEFDLLKFRSMVDGAGEHRCELIDLNEVDGPVFKMRNDPRITPIGYLMRRASIDELPQLWNVLRGEMSLVGPRPPLPAEVEAYGPWERQRLVVKPGITCIWQVSGRSDLDFETWVSMDIEYIESWSLWLDLKLLARTVPAVLSGEGAY